MQRIFSSFNETVGLERTLWTMHDKLWITLPHGPGRALINAAEFTPLEDRGHRQPPFLELPHHAMDDLLRAFMEIAWDQGLRPSGFEDFENELKATRRHLEDMRALAFKGKQP